MSLQPVGEVEVVEVGGDDGDAVVVLTGRMTLDGDYPTSSCLAYSNLFLYVLIARRSS